MKLRRPRGARRGCCWRTGKADAGARLHRPGRVSGPGYPPSPEPPVRGHTFPVKLVTRHNVRFITVMSSTASILMTLLVAKIAIG